MYTYGVGAKIVRTHIYGGGLPLNRAIAAVARGLAELGQSPAAATIVRSGLVALRDFHAVSHADTFVPGHTLPCDKLQMSAPRLWSRKRPRTRTQQTSNVRLREERRSRQVDRGRDTSMPSID